MKDQWKMPKWMEPYREMFANTGGNSVEDLMNRSPNEANVFVNAPVALICVAVKSQVTLLENLHAAGKLAGAF